VDTGDYLEPPEGFLESQYETLKEWYDANPENDPASQHFIEKAERDASVPLSPEQEVLVHSDLTEDDIPEMDEQTQEEAVQETINLVKEIIAPLVHVSPDEVDEDFDDEPPF
jgi:twinkle protein